MKKILVICFVVLMFSGNSFADLRYISTEESVKESDFIVIGTLQSISDIYQDHPNFGSVSIGDGKGILVIEKIVAGNVLSGNGLSIKSGDKLTLKWSEASMCLSGWHRRTENKKGIWLLSIDKNGAVETSHPAQFASLSEFSEIKKNIKKYSEKFSKTVVINNQENRNSDFPQQIAEIPRTNKTETSALPKTPNHYPFRAFLAILASLSLYGLLYRSKFKIR